MTWYEVHWRGAEIGKHDDLECAKRQVERMCSVWPEGSDERKEYAVIQVKRSQRQVWP